MSSAPSPLPCRNSAAVLWLLVAVLGVLLIPGCGGCVDDPVTAKRKQDEAKKKAADDRKKKELEKEERDFAIDLTMQPLPAGDPSALIRLKPGHWTFGTQRYQRNKADFQGELASYISARDGAMPLPLDDAPYRIAQQRPALLAKGQPKQLETAFFIPRRTWQTVAPTVGDQFAGPTKNLWLFNRLLDRATGLEVHLTSHLFQAAPAYQYQLVVLSDSPDRYGFLKTLPTIEIKGDPLAPEATNFLYYQVILARTDRRMALPSHPLAWTQVAALVWDDFDPNVLTLEQQEALVDWLHWGGQVIVSGPTSLAALRSSFLAPYLPVRDAQPNKLTAEAFEELNDRWTLPEPKGRRPLAVVPGNEPSGLALQLADGASFAEGTGKLVAERQVGRGRLAVTAFALTSREVINWPGLDNFTNGCLLRRPARRFQLDNNTEEPYYTWSLPARTPGDRADARFVSHLRYFSRDLGGFSRTGEMSPDWLATPRTSNSTEDYSRRSDSAPSPHRGYLATADSGVAGWNDFSGVAQAARSALKEAAGIKVPERRLVLQMLAAYLVVLVPLNWGFFRLIGRVEWAWIAAPIIAIAGAVGLVRMVQLDIGFVRSRTELAVLEIQGAHPRAHLTRYTALYTSLTTNYDATFNHPTSLALPLATGRPNDPRQAALYPTVELRRDEGVSLRGFPVDSNATGLIHAEQMLSLGGELKYSPGERPVVRNGTTLNLQGAVVVRRAMGGAFEAAWLGDLAPGASRTFTFVPVAATDPWQARWNESPVTSATPPEGELNLRRVLELAADPRGLHEGDVRLLAWTDEELGEVQYDPPASQNLVRTAVVAQLRYAPLPPPATDVNTAAAAK